MRARRVLSEVEVSATVICCLESTSHVVRQVIEANSVHDPGIGKRDRRARRPTRATERPRTPFAAPRSSRCAGAVGDTMNTRMPYSTRPSRSSTSTPSSPIRRTEYRGKCGTPRSVVGRRGRAPAPDRATGVGAGLWRHRCRLFRRGGIGHWFGASLATECSLDREQVVRLDRFAISFSGQDRLLAHSDIDHRTGDLLHLGDGPHPGRRPSHRWHHDERRLCPLPAGAGRRSGATVRTGRGGCLIEHHPHSRAGLRIDLEVVGESGLVDPVLALACQRIDGCSRSALDLPERSRHRP